MKKETSGFCTHCGLTKKEWNETHSLGCSRCYVIFADEVEAYLKKRNFSTNYTEGLNSTLEWSLKQALKREDYEEAARIRDVLQHSEEK